MGLRDFPIYFLFQDFTCTSTFPSQIKGRMDPACMEIEINVWWLYICLWNWNSLIKHEKLPRNYEQCNVSDMNIYIYIYIKPAFHSLKKWRETVEPQSHYPDRRVRWEKEIKEIRKGKGNKIYKKYRKKIKRREARKKGEAWRDT